MKAKQSVKHEAVAERARALWEKAGWPNGRDDEFWFQAENELRTEHNSGIPTVIATARKAPPPQSAAPPHQVPPPIRGAAKVPARRAAQSRSQKNPRTA